MPLTLSATVLFCGTGSFCNPLRAVEDGRAIGILQGGAIR
jgi:hypothetical protein